MQQPQGTQQRFQALVAQHAFALTFVLFGLLYFGFLSLETMSWALLGACAWGGSYALLGSCYFSCFGAQQVQAAWRILCVGWMFRVVLALVLAVGLSWAGVAPQVWAPLFQGVLCAHVAVVVLSVRLGRE